MNKYGKILIFYVVEVFQNMRSTLAQYVKMHLREIAAPSKFYTTRDTR